MLFFDDEPSSSSRETSILPEMHSCYIYEINRQKEYKKKVTESQ